jgi:hypothetical protein
MKPRPKEWIREREARRTELHTRAVQGLFILNGGGAIALLTFVQQVWEKSASIVPYAVCGLLAMTVGLLLAAPINLVRYESSRLHDRYESRAKGVAYGRRWRWLFRISLGLFFVGVLIVAVGILLNLPR